MKKFFIKISGIFSAFFQKIFKPTKKVKNYDDNIQELYGIPPEILKEMEKDKKIQPAAKSPITDNPGDRIAQKLYGVPRPRNTENTHNKED